MQNILKFFDRLERKIRGKLSHYPILYAFIGGIGVVLFWRGVWHTADEMNMGSTISVIIGVVILIITGVFVSSFIGNQLIISGLVGEKKIAEKEEEELQTEEMQLKSLQSTLNRLEKKLEHIDKEVEENHPNTNLQ
ncbi:MAG: hypothetical protein WC847_01805 [Candidatus Paceibacterota bacterium]|jgi:hypothetical protein